MAEDNSSQLLEAMDRLWFHHVILSSDSTSVLHSKTALQSSSTSSSESFLFEGENASTFVCTPSSISQNDLNNEVEAKRQDENSKERKRLLSRLEIYSNKYRSKSSLSSPSIHRPHMSFNLSNNQGQKLERFLSCSKLHDLELEELRGFMDLGFQFEKDRLSPRTIRVLPGLQRILRGHDDNNDVVVAAKSRFDELVEGKSEQTIMSMSMAAEVVDKPYLSEAWLVKRPDSPLLRMRMARVKRAEDMHNCLKLWARIVASSLPFDD